MFNKVRIGQTERNTFDLSHHQVTTADFGQLIPICYKDLLPNDEVTVKPDLFCRLAPLAVPVYGKIKARVFHFFVPYRVLYGYWDSFITQSTSNHTVPPYFTIGAIQSLLNADPQINPSASIFKRGTFVKLMSNLGLNPETVNTRLGTNERIAAFPFLAYYKIWLDYFMDSNLNDHAALDMAFKLLTENGGNLNSVASQFLQYRNSCYKKDYFTTAKVSPQEGDASSVKVEPGFELYENSSSDIGEMFDPTITLAGYRDDQSGVPQFGNQLDLSSDEGSDTFGSFTVEALRAATALQRYNERNNYVGTKIINRILAHFGITPSAERLDMAEFLGSSSMPIIIGDVTSHNSLPDQTQSGYSTMGLGLQAGKGVGAGSMDSVKYHAKEHGVFLTLLNVLPDTSYYQGISRFWQKGVNGDPLDYYTPEFENLGFQEVLNKELYIPSVYEQDTEYQGYQPDGVFGYVPRFSEYKFSYDVLGSDFIGAEQTEGVTGSYMDSWHLFRKLKFTDSKPLALNENFVVCNNNNEDFDRIFQYTDNEFDHFYFNIDVDFKAVRNMVGFAEPAIDTNNMLGSGRTVNIPYGGTRL